MTKYLMCLCMVCVYIVAIVDIVAHHSVDDSPLQMIDGHNQRSDVFSYAHQTATVDYPSEW